MSLILSGSSGLSDVDGSASTPSLRGTDADSGVFFPAADTVAIATGGTERARVDSSGNVGIGTSSPLSVLDVVVGASGARRLLVNYDDSVITVKGASNTAAPETLRLVADNIRFNTSTTGSGTERARIDSSGNFLVGTTSSSNKFTVYQSNTTDWATYASSQYTASGFGYIALWARGGGAVNAALRYRDASTSMEFYSPSGHTVAYTTSSDYRLKENIQPMVGALAKVSALKPVTYKWKEGFGKGSSHGFIAHELQSVVPEAVTGEKDAVDADDNPVYQGIDTSFLVATLTAALQEAHGLIKDLQSRVDALEVK